MLKVKINGKKSFEINNDTEKIVINNKNIDWNIIEIKENYYHIIHDNKTYTAELVKTDESGKNQILKINNTLFTIQIEDKYDQLLERLGIKTEQASMVKDIKAPMPGLIIEIKAETGKQVKKGDPLLILEAMKMENVIKSPSDGEIKSIKVKKGDSVEKNQVLIQF
jgi:biotin carboxyl carrier protein